MQPTRNTIRTIAVTVAAGAAMLGIWTAGAWLGNHMTPLGALVALVALLVVFGAWVMR